MQDKTETEQLIFKGMPVKFNEAFEGMKNWPAKKQLMHLRRILTDPKGGAVLANPDGTLEIVPRDRLSPTEFITDWHSLNLQSYDIILCAGNGKMSRLIQHYNRVIGVDGEAATISHVAMYYHGAFLHAGQRRPLCFESTTLNKWAGKEGVQLNSFQKWLDNYDGKVYIRKLDFERTAFHIKRLDSFTLSQIGMPYESGIPGKIELLFTGMSIPIFSQWRKRTIEIHCSENNVEALQYGKLYLPTVYPNKMPPFEFWNGGRFETFLLKPIEIGEAVRIK